MKNVTVLSMIIFFSMSFFLTAQNTEEWECGMPEVTSSPEALLQKNHCFNVGLVQQTCAKVWVRINVHFFLDDNCEGTLDPLGIEQIPIEDAYQVAEQYVSSANGQMDNLYQQWVQIPRWNINQVKPAQCSPIRYALSGVYIHCNTSARNTSGSNVLYFRNNFGVNVNTEFNAFLVEWVGGSTGQADALGGRAFTAENLTRSVFNHEMGHVLGLRHTFDEPFIEGIDDTPNVRYRIDFNCDGDTNDNWSSAGGLNETTWRRGIWCHPGDCGVVSGVMPIDYNGDGIIDYPNPCDPALIASGCLPEPGCSWDYHSNNLMHYGGYLECCGAFTEGQITRMLEYLSTPQGCEYKEVITDDICVPPMSNIHILPTEFTDGDCAFCFQIQASVHDEHYKLDFLRPNGTLQYTTDWQDGPAQEFCISNTLKYPNLYKYGFVPGTQYTAVLTVENDCGEEAVESINFTLPSLPQNGCSQLPDGDIEIKNVYPNPFVHSVNIEYKTDRSGSLEAWLIPHNTGGSDMLLATEYVPSAGTYAKTVYTTQALPGLYYLVLVLDGEVISKALIKI